MTINYTPFENNLTSARNDCATQMQTTASADLDAIVKRIIQQVSTSTEADIAAVLEGARVNFGGPCELLPRQTGVFNDITDSFDSSRPRIDVDPNPGARIRKAVGDSARAVKAEGQGTQ